MINGFNNVVLSNAVKPGLGYCNVARPNCLELGNHKPIKQDQQLPRSLVPYFSFPKIKIKTPALNATKINDIGELYILSNFNCSCSQIVTQVYPYWFLNITIFIRQCAWWSDHKSSWLFFSTIPTLSVINK